MDTGEMLKTCRKIKGITIADLAKACGRSTGTICRAENTVSCRTDTFEMILHALGFEMDVYPMECEREPGIVLCKDCIYWQKHDWSWCGRFENEYHGDGYCPEGVRRP